MNIEIQKYLNGQSHDFNQGFALFCKYSRNQSLMSWIGRKRDMVKLIYELKKLANSEPRVNAMQQRHICRFNKFLGIPAPEPVQAEAPAPVPEPVQAEAPAPAPIENEDADCIKFKTFDERKTRRADLPKNLQKVYDDIVGDYKLRRGYHEKMKMTQDQKERAKNRALLLETQDRIEKGWKLIDSYLLDQAKKKVETEFKESTCRSYLSKMLKKDNLTPEQIEKLRIRVDALVEHKCKFSEDIAAQLKTLNLL